MRFAASVLTLSLVATSAVARSFLKRDAVAVLLSIDLISGNLTQLNNDLNTFAASSTLAHGLAINSDAGKLDTAVKSATAAVKATPSVSEKDGNTILNATQGLKEGIVLALTSMRTLKPKFAALPVSNSVALVLSDLQTLFADTKGFEIALLGITPADLVSSANQITAAVNDAFTATIAVYS